MAEQFKCAACGGEFASAEALQAHAKAEHQQAQQFSCGACGGTFGSQEELRAHAQAAHARM